MKAAASKTPISDYRCCGLVDLGILKLVVVEPKDFTKEIVGHWKRIRKAASLQDEIGIREGLRQLDNIERMTKSKDKGYVLTDLGKQVARGVAVKLNGQYKTVPC